MTKIRVRTLSVSIAMLSCVAILSLPACGKRGPLYHSPQRAETIDTKIDDVKVGKNSKNKQAEK